MGDLNRMRTSNKTMMEKRNKKNGNIELERKKLNSCIYIKININI
jgi:hypothetical protein